MKIEKFNYNSIDDLCANTYVISDSQSNCVVIDPSVDYDGVINYINKNRLKLKGVLLTHGHFDHIKGVDRLISTFRVPLYVHKDDECMLKNPNINMSLSINVVVNSSPTFLEDNEILKLLEDDIKAIHTPFHTKGSVCYYFVNNKLLFSGDTLFNGSIGRDDLPNAIPTKRRESLSKIKKLPKETKIFPGHGSNTVLETELNINAFLNNDYLV